MGILDTFSEGFEAIGDCFSAFGNNEEKPIAKKQEETIIKEEE